MEHFLQGNKIAKGNNSMAEKILGETRRNLILQWLLDSTIPITGNELAEKTNVSRQVIVQDISILKARSHKILATSQGYMYLREQQGKVTQIIACCHTPEESEKELTIIVDHGVSVKDVVIEHPIYGDLTASLMVSNRKEVKDFIQKVKQTNALLLSELTNGIHLHTIEANNQNQIEEVKKALQKEGLLIQ